MEIRTVNSSNIQEVGYDSAKKVLRVKFTSGAMYDYHNVDEQLYRHLLQAPSVGAFFHAYIKNRHVHTKVV